MNLLHLKYAVEVERTQSMTRAAANLFTGQPNLSRAIKELEETLGVVIFKRTPMGIVPTPQGEEVLAYARNILAQIDEVESLYKREEQNKQVFNISIPRASYITYAFTRMVASLDLSKDIEINYKETNSMRAINNILQGNYGLGIIRYQAIFEDYFISMLKEKELKFEELWEFKNLVLMSCNHPLAEKEEINTDDMSAYIEIAHGDPYVPSLSLSEVKKSESFDTSTKRIFVYERGSQFDLLSNVHHTYMWVSPLPTEMLKKYSLIQRKCTDANRVYKDVLIFRNHYKLTALDQKFLEEVKRVQDEVSNIVYK
ncbi:MAG: LysR family transcriptional regulator [Anaerolineae bacterium]|nr:LysR family transcriptional regulator [Anaerolineae bacterium]